MFPMSGDIIPGRGKGEEFAKKGKNIKRMEKNGGKDGKGKWGRWVDPIEKIWGFQREKD